VSRGGEDDICRFETFSPERGHAGPLLGVQSYRVWASRANMDILVLSLILPENILIVGPVRPGGQEKDTRRVAGFAKLKWVGDLQSDWREDE
jgi:hypothetical protein